MRFPHTGNNLKNWMISDAEWFELEDHRNTVEREVNQ